MLMKKSITFLLALFIFLLLINPISASATLYMYSGKGVFSADYGAVQYNVSETMLISDQLMLYNWGNGIDQPVQVTPGVPLQTGVYYFNIYNWHMNVQKIGNFSGKTGSLSAFTFASSPDPSTSGFQGDAWYLTSPSFGSAGEFWSYLQYLNDPGYGKLPADIRFVGTAGLGGPGGPIIQSEGGEIELSLERRGAVPEPSMLLLLGSGLAGFTWFITRRKRKKYFPRS